MDSIMKQVSVVALAIVGIAIVAVIVSERAKTSDVIGSAGRAFTDALRAATGPVTGGFGGLGG